MSNILKTSKNLRICITAPFVPFTGGMSTQAEMLSKHLEDEGFIIHRIRTKTATPLKLKAFWNILKYARHSDIIHTHCSSYWGFLPAVMSFIASKLYKKRFIITYHGGEASYFIKKFGFIILPILKRIDTIIVPSDFLREVFNNFGVTTVVLPNMLDVDQYTYAERNSLKPDIVIVKHLETIYNIEMALKMFRIVKDRFPEARLTIVGGGPQRDVLKKLADELNLKDVVFTGQIRHDQVSDMYAASDIFIHCSKVESFGMVLLEAAASGLPIVSTNVGGISSIIKNEENGLLVESDDSADMAKKVIYLLEHPREALKLAHNARKLSETYTWDSIRSKLMEIYAT